MPFENNTNYIVSRTIADAWYDAMWCCIRNGYDYKIEQGSYVGQIRRQLDHVVIRITEPWSRPLTPLLPEGSGIPPTTSDEKIDKYFVDYIIGNEKSDNEDYTYGQYISAQLPRIIGILNTSQGNSNQACITIGEPENVFLNDPPCLKLIDFKVVEQRLNMSVYFRSNDLFAAMPENLGGMQMLKEYLLLHLDFPVTDGEILYYSGGLHLYEMYFPLVNQLNVDKIQI